MKPRDPRKVRFLRALASTVRMALRVSRAPPMSRNSLLMNSEVKRTDSKVYRPSLNTSTMPTAKHLQRGLYEVPWRREHQETLLSPFLFLWGTQCISIRGLYSAVAGLFLHTLESMAKP